MTETQPQPRPHTHTEATAPVRIVVADDHEVVRAGYAGLLATQPDFTVVGTARDGAEAVRICREQQPDVVLMDVRMPVMDRIQAATELMTSLAGLDGAAVQAAPRGRTGGRGRGGVARARHHTPPDRRVRAAEAPSAGAADARRVDAS